MDDKELKERIEAVMLFDGWIKAEVIGEGFFYTYLGQNKSIKPRSIHESQIDYSKLEYHTSYEWLIPVWHKFWDMADIVRSRIRATYFGHTRLIANAIAYEPNKLKVFKLYRMRFYGINQ